MEDQNNNVSVSDSDEMKIEIDETDDSIMCDECSEILPWKDKLLLHKKNKHLRLICNECGYEVLARIK